MATKSKKSKKSLSKGKKLRTVKPLSKGKYLTYTMDQTLVSQ